VQSQRAGAAAPSRRGALVRTLESNELLMNKLRKTPVTLTLTLTLSEAKGKGKGKRKGLRFVSLRSFAEPSASLRACFAAQNDGACYKGLNCGSHRGRPDG